MFLDGDVFAGVSAVAAAVFLDIRFAFAGGDFLCRSAAQPGRRFADRSLIGLAAGFVDPSAHRCIRHCQDCGWLWGIVAGSQDGRGKCRHALPGDAVFLRGPRNCVFHGGTRLGGAELEWSWPHELGSALANAMVSVALFLAHGSVEAEGLKQVVGRSVIGRWLEPLNDRRFAITVTSVT